MVSASWYELPGDRAFASTVFLRVTNIPIALPTLVRGAASIGKQFYTWLSRRLVA